MPRTSSNRIHCPCIIKRLFRFLLSSVLYLLPEIQLFPVVKQNISFKLRFHFDDMAPRLRGAKRKKLVQFSSYRRHSDIVQLLSMFRIIFKEASNNYPWLEWVKSGLFPENFFSSARLNFSFSFQRNSTTVRHTATCWLFNQWRDPAVHFSLLQYLLLSLFFFFSVSPSATAKSG